MEPMKVAFTFTSGATIQSWDNKAHPEVKMHALDSAKPTLNANINGLKAVKFHADNARMYARKGGATGSQWNPLGVDGAIDSTYNDFAVIFVVQFNNLTWNNAAFNFGWAYHIPGGNGLVSGTTQTMTVPG